MATLTRRKLVLWFLFSQILSIYWLSSPYGPLFSPSFILHKSKALFSPGRNWQFLWQTGQIHTWVVVILAAFFFVVYVLRHL